MYRFTTQSLEGYYFPGLSSGVLVTALTYIFIGERFNPQEMIFQGGRVTYIDLQPNHLEGATIFQACPVVCLLSVFVMVVMSGEVGCWSA